MSTDPSLMPPLTGSDKQVSWAEKIRNDCLAALDQMLASTMAPDHIPAAKAAYREAIARQASARWWIDMRGQDGKVPPKVFTVNPNLKRTLAELADTPVARPVVYLDAAALASEQEVPGWQETTYDGPRGESGPTPGQPVWLHPNPQVVAPLLAGVADVVWASTWEQAAPKWLAPALGLPADLPALELRVPWDCAPQRRRVALRAAIETYARNRPYVRLAGASELTPADANITRERDEEGTATLLVTVEDGLTSEHIAQVTAWLEQR